MSIPDPSPHAAPDPVPDGAASPGADGAAVHDRLLTAGDDEAPRPGRAIVVDEDGTVHFLDEQDEDADGRTGDVDDEHPGPDEDGR